MKSLRCISTTTIKWFVTFGRVDKFMYLLEVSKYKRGALRVTGIFDPSPIIENEAAYEYFYDQFLTSKCKSREFKNVLTCFMSLVRLPPIFEPLATIPSPLPPSMMSLLDIRPWRHIQKNVLGT